MDELNASECLAEKDIREVWRKVPGDHYSPSIQVFDNGNAVRFNVDGKCVTMPAEKWVDMAWGTPPPPEAGAVEEALEADLKWAESLELAPPRANRIAASHRSLTAELAEALEWRASAQASENAVLRLEGEVNRLTRDFSEVSAERDNLIGHDQAHADQVRSLNNQIARIMDQRDKAEAELRRLSALPSALMDGIDRARGELGRVEFAASTHIYTINRAKSILDALAGSAPAALPGEGLSEMERDAMNPNMGEGWFNAEEKKWQSEYLRDIVRRLLPSAPVEKAKPVPCGFPDRHFNASFPDSCPECPPPPKDPQ